MLFLKHTFRLPAHHRVRVHDMGTPPTPEDDGPLFDLVFVNLRDNGTESKVFMMSADLRNMSESERYALIKVLAPLRIRAPFRHCLPDL
jgi:hypothetical protein